MRTVGGFEGLVLPETTLAFADAIDADLPRLAALEALDTGKPVAIAETVDIPATIAWLRTYAGWPSKRENGPEVLDAYLEPKSVVMAPA
jgi:acyl-CoA reductase-like NAD-dependent aldehyde dehydrogenase